MTFSNWISILIPLIGFTITGLVWLVRLEGKHNNNTLRISTLEDKTKHFEDTKLEVVRVQEQIKQLKELLERYLKEVHNGR